MNKGARHQIAIAGKVIYSRTGRNVEGASVRASGPSIARTRTAPDGLFYFFDLPEGRYTVQASLSGAGKRYATGERDAEVVRDTSGQIRMATVILPLDGTTVTGKISEEHGGGLIMAEVRLKGSGERVFSDAQGQYVLAGIEPGNRTILVHLRGYKPASHTVGVEGAGSSQTIDFTLLPETR
jgi:CarboxypepD_reg-like domain/Carboxypeptidase regulatory-like domain